MINGLRRWRSGRTKNGSKSKSTGEQYFNPSHTRTLMHANWFCGLSKTGSYKRSAFLWLGPAVCQKKSPYCPSCRYDTPLLLHIRNKFILVDPWISSVISNETFLSGRMKWPVFDRRAGGCCHDPNWRRRACHRQQVTGWMWMFAAFAGKLWANLRLCFCE